MNRWKKILTAVILLSASALVSAYEPPPGGTEWYSFSGAGIMIAGEQVTDTFFPQSSAVNPALAGLAEGFTFSGSYIGLSGFSGITGDSGLRGHSFNIGFTVPKPFGVLSWGGGFTMSPFSSINLGFTGHGRLGFSKKIYESIVLGGAAKAAVGYLDRFDAGIMLDFGILYLPGAQSGDNGVRLGAVLRDLGKWYDPDNSHSAFPPPFTPSVGGSFRPFSESGSYLEVYGGADFPSFQNIILRTGAKFSFRDIFTVHTGWSIDIRELADPLMPNRSLIPSFGISLAFGGNRTGIDKDGPKNVTVNTGARSYYNGIWGIGGGTDIRFGTSDTIPPEVSMEYSETYISPNNDGIKESLEIPITIRDDNLIKGFRFVVYGPDGEVFKTIENIDERPELRDVDSFIDSLLSVESGITIPDSIHWDGRDNSGNVLPDGEYYIILESWDSKGNIGSSGQYRITIDNGYPEVSLKLPVGDNLLFSPDGDGRKDTITILQSGSSEAEWTGIIENAETGEVILEKAWQGVPPEKFIWDGRSSSGILQDDGIYRYQITALDSGGNEVTASVENIILRKEIPEVSLTISLGVFSPNRDGVKDYVEITPVVPESAARIKEWSFTVSNRSGTPVLSRRESGSLPGSFIFDGRNDAGKLLEEGAYSAELNAVYRNGGISRAQSPVFIIDITAPQATAQSGYDIFSPDGDGQREFMVFYNETTQEDVWRGKITDSEGNIVKTYFWTGDAGRKSEWDGRTDSGGLAPDGVYSYRLYATDLGGNTGSSNTVNFVLDTSKTAVVVSSDREAFSPDSDGKNDTVRFKARISDSTGNQNDIIATRWNVLDRSGKPVWTWEDPENLVLSIEWSGTDVDGFRVDDGEYRGQVVFTRKNGSTSTARTNFLTVDTKAPNAVLRTETTIFSPNNDGNKDLIFIEQDTSSEEKWEGIILDNQNNPVRKYAWSGTARNLIWNGTDEAGNIVPDGVYRYRLESKDKAGNTAVTTINKIIVDNRKVSNFVTVDSKGFSPNGDGITDTITINTYTSIPEHVEIWKLQIIDKNDVPVRTFTGSEMEQNRSFVWDGKNNQGGTSEGIYSVVYEARYDKGDNPKAESPDFVLDNAPPVLTVSAAPLPFSPDNDGIRDSLNITISARDSSEIASWRLDIIDQKNNLFKSFSGKGNPLQRISWDGHSENGELVDSAQDYPYQVVVTDVYGNTNQKIGLIPVDILVIRDGNKLKVRIKNINFQPNSPRLIVDPGTEEGRKNQEILRRLVEIFTKYDSYSIRIEGHAVNVTGTEREERNELQPLSLARAEMVKEALMALGLSGERIKAAGMGGTDPLVPHTDTENRWKNRRVEFILVK
ncbi:MAG: FlgD immunoglobulin-like domain containing protein [Spirochaetia bacterium]